MAKLLKHPLRLALFVGGICITLQLALAVTGILPSVLIPILSLGIVIPAGQLLSTAQKNLERSESFANLVI